MSKLPLELTPEEMLALGYCIGVGMSRAEKDQNVLMVEHTRTLMDAVYRAMRANAKRKAREP